MRRLGLMLLLLSCTLDPQGVLGRAALKVQAFGLPENGELKLSTTDSRPQTRTKKTKVRSDMMEIIYEEGSLVAGPVSISAEAYDAEGSLVGCGTARGVVGTDEVVIVGFASPSTSDVNCGTCGNRCETELASGVCRAGRCTGWECPPGFESDGGGGCHEPIIEVPDAGPPDAGPGDAGMMMTTDGGSDGGTDAGMPPLCVPMPELTDVACSDGVDNDCDLRVDCNDVGCAGLTRDCTVASCGRMGTQSWSCATRTWSACAIDPAAEATTTACKDGIDNDCDGKLDCADERCNDISQSCGIDICAAGIKLWNCQLGIFNLLCLPYIPLAENNNLLCGNGADDDCDGKTDCLDNLCRGRTCGSGKVCCADGGCAPGC
ncbi:MAG: hypothetical protein JNK82_20450 [Myxococcaceae bacterium]|nr:hypothetical protein [Myxococcaceae bacterium]